MSQADWNYLKAVTNATFANGAFRQNLYIVTNAIGQTGQDVANYAETAASYNATMAATYALAAALGAGTQAIGIGENALPRTYELGSAAFVDTEVVRSILPVLKNASFQITAHDHGKLFYTTSGGPWTWTLPLYADTPPGFHFYARNRSGSNLTLARTGSDSINGVAGNLTIATGSIRLGVNRLDVAATWEAA